MRSNRKLEAYAKRWDRAHSESVYNPANKRSEWVDKSTYAGIRGLSRECRAQRSINITAMRIR